MAKSNLLRLKPAQTLISLSLASNTLCQRTQHGRRFEQTQNFRTAQKQPCSASAQTVRTIPSKATGAVAPPVAFG
eukprot:scaffold286265_cov14-Tisochrysis_lutea.AAC.1